MARLKEAFPLPASWLGGPASEGPAGLGVALAGWDMLELDDKGDSGEQQGPPTPPQASHQVQGPSAAGATCLHVPLCMQLSTSELIMCKRSPAVRLNCITTGLQAWRRCWAMQRLLACLSTAGRPRNAEPPCSQVHSLHSQPRSYPAPRLWVQSGHAWGPLSSMPQGRRLQPGQLLPAQGSTVLPAQGRTALPVRRRTLLGRLQPGQLLLPLLQGSPVQDMVAKQLQVLLWHSLPTSGMQAQPLWLPAVTVALQSKLQ